MCPNCLSNTLWVSAVADLEVTFNPDGRYHINKETVCSEWSPMFARCFCATCRWTGEMQEVTAALESHSKIRNR